MRNDSYHAFDHEINDVQKLIDKFFCYSFLYFQKKSKIE